MERSAYNRVRVIVSLIAIVIYCVRVYPVQTITFFIIALITYLIWNFLNKQSKIGIANQGDERRRLYALDTAKLYLSPYDDIWKNLRLSNKFCTLRLTYNQEIEGTEKTSAGRPYRKFKIISSRVHPMNDLWDMFCLNFKHNTSYVSLIEDCQVFNVVIEEKIIGVNGQNDPPLPKMNYSSNEKEDIVLQNVEKVDINNASELEITSLPGISIVIAKKILRKREEISGFKNMEELFAFLNLKPHIENQVKQLICIKPKEGSLKIERYTERRVDF